MSLRSEVVSVRPFYPLWPFGLRNYEQSLVSQQSMFVWTLLALMSSYFTGLREGLVV